MADARFALPVRAPAVLARRAALRQPRHRRRRHRGERGARARRRHRLPAAGVVNAALDFWNVFLFAFVQNRVVRRLRSTLFAKILRQEAAFDAAGSLSSRLTSDCVAIAPTCRGFSATSPRRRAGRRIAGYLLFQNARLGLVACGATPLVALVARLYGEWMSANASASQEALAAANAAALEAIANARTVKAFASEVRIAPVRPRAGAVVRALHDAGVRHRRLLRAGVLLLLATSGARRAAGLRKRAGAGGRDARRASRRRHAVPATAAGVRRQPAGRGDVHVQVLRRGVRPRSRSSTARARARVRERRGRRLLGDGEAERRALFVPDAAGAAGARA